MILLDTHALIWTLFDSSNLSQNAKDTIIDSDSLYVSIVSLWEIAIKQNIGKLNLKNSIQEIAKICEEENIEILPIRPSEIDYVKQLPFEHRDPFDRLIIAQAKVNGLSILSKDTQFLKYDINIIWQALFGVSIFLHSYTT